MRKMHSLLFEKPMSNIRGIFNANFLRSTTATRFEKSEWNIRELSVVPSSIHETMQLNCWLVGSKYSLLHLFCDYQIEKSFARCQVSERYKGLKVSVYFCCSTHNSEQRFPRKRNYSLRKICQYCLAVVKLANSAIVWSFITFST